MGINISSLARCSRCTFLLPKRTLSLGLRHAQTYVFSFHLLPTQDHFLPSPDSLFHQHPNSAYTKPDSLDQIQEPSDSYPYLTGLLFSAFPYILPFVLVTLWLYLVLPCLCAFTFSVSLMHLPILFWLSELDSLCKSLVTLFGHSFLEP